MPTIGMKDAVKIAKSTLAELFEDEPLKMVALEEIDLVKERNIECWAVTLGFHRTKSVTTTNVSAWASALTQPTQVENRVYKTLYIDAQTGQFLRMDLRLVN